VDEKQSHSWYQIISRLRNKKEPPGIRSFVAFPTIPCEVDNPWIAASISVRQGRFDQSRLLSVHCAIFFDVDVLG
jgi:hypothetical protein